MPKVRCGIQISRLPGADYPPKPECQPCLLVLHLTKWISVTDLPITAGEHMAPGRVCENMRVRILSFLFCVVWLYFWLNVAFCEWKAVSFSSMWQTRAAECEAQNSGQKRRCVFPIVFVAPWVRCAEMFCFATLFLSCTERSCAVGDRRCT